MSNMIRQMFKEWPDIEYPYIEGLFRIASNDSPFVWMGQWSRFILQRLKSGIIYMQVYWFGVKFNVKKVEKTLVDLKGVYFG